VVAVSVARHDRALSTTALVGLAALVWPGATLTGALEVGRRLICATWSRASSKLAWGNPIEREMMGVR